MSPLDDEMNQAVAELKRIRAAADDAEKVMADTSHTLMSKRRLFSVTVDAGGNLTALTFNGEAYRSLAPAELAQLIVDTTKTAREQCMAEAAKAVHEIWPEAGADFDIMNGATNLDDLMNGFMKAMGSSFNDAEVEAFEDSWKTDK